jgi:hypothetical protein
MHELRHSIQSLHRKAAEFHDLVAQAWRMVSWKRLVLRPDLIGAHQLPGGEPVKNVLLGPHVKSPAGGLHSRAVRCMLSVGLEPIMEIPD